MQTIKAAINEVMTEQLAHEINAKNYRYISIMIDGATDASGKENETVHCRFVKDGQPVNRLVGHKAVSHAHAQGDFILAIPLVNEVKYLSGKYRT